MVYFCKVGLRTANTVDMCGRQSANYCISNLLSSTSTNFIVSGRHLTTLSQKLNGKLFTGTLCTPKSKIRAQKMNSRPAKTKHYPRTRNNDMLDDRGN